MRKLISNFHFQIEDMIRSMLKPVRIDAGLGDPPKEYTNNDPEAANFMIKYGLKFESKKPHEFVSAVKQLVKLQQNNEERAVFGKGPYDLADQFKHLAVSDHMWGKLSHPQKSSKVNKFLLSGMDQAETAERHEINSVLHTDADVSKMTLTAEQS